MRKPLNKKVSISSLDLVDFKDFNLNDFPNH